MSSSSSSRYTLTPPLFFFLFIIIVQHASSQLLSTQLTTMNNLNELIQTVTNNSKWDSSQNPCSWTGVFCTQNTLSITNLSLSSFSLSQIVNASSWSSLVCQIETLQSLDLSNNHLTSIPPPLLSSCTALKVLNFSNNKLTGLLPGFDTGLRSLEVLDLSRNSFDSVSIDSQFESLHNLKSLNISYNSFTGPVPVKLGESMLLQELQISMNSFTGVIPDRIIEYRNLSVLDLSYNRLTGSIPAGIGQLSSLEQLVLSANNLTGAIPLSIARMPALKRFSANQNGFTGPIPDGITSHVRNLDLSYNNLNGSIASDLLLQPNLLTVDLSSNNLEGFIPVNASKSLFRLRLGSNRLTGTIPIWSFGDADSSLTYLELDHNDLNGMIPPELGLYKNLSLLDLSHNNLVGSVPPELGDLNSLQVVHLDHNRLSGEIPNEISGLQFLVKLNMSWNSLNGPIPPSLSRLSNLTNLDLQVNNLSGPIPDSFASMDLLLELQLGMNKLGGVVRFLPTNLQIALNLSRNNFEGRIPDSLSRLQALEVLDLSNNRFSGVVPSSLGGMGNLIQLDLSNNLLTGSVPRFRQNVTVAIDGNINLSDTRSNSPPLADWKYKKTSSIGIVVASIAAVVALVILVVVAVIVSRKINGLKSKLLTYDVIHITNLDCTKALQRADYASCVVSKTRFSTYYKAVMPSGMTYLVKKVNESARMFQLVSHDLIEQELETVGSLTNSNVMIPLAYALTIRSAYLFYEFTEKGSLFDVLHGSLRSCLDWTNRYSIALGVANGLDFLHGCSSGPIILLDLSSKGVMLKSLNEPQIGDIELSKVIDPSKSTRNLSVVAGSVGYVPPEYAYTMRVTMAGNVYSFGVILLELLTGKTAVSEGFELANWVSNELEEKHNFDQMLDSVVSGTSPTVRDQMLAVLKVALACVNVLPEARPDTRSVLRMLLDARN
ncbi:hypothetical protein QVD17_02241 [Tagetes erecta]|uniref:Protein kinase domain-containing protein n=1 Tax=Tagetes erecta TaxID=13708 RepID=A0AAD8LC27_TARER|nr:hypothetical protein QVD17_02241 [Tagetes erecta]